MKPRTANNTGATRRMEEIPRATSTATVRHHLLRHTIFSPTRFDFEWRVCVSESPPASSFARWVCRREPHSIGFPSSQRTQLCVVRFQSFVAGASLELACDEDVDRDVVRKLRQEMPKSGLHRVRLGTATPSTMIQLLRRCASFSMGRSSARHSAYKPLACWLAR